MVSVVQQVAVTRHKETLVKVAVAVVSLLVGLTRQPQLLLVLAVAVVLLLHQVLAVQVKAVVRQ
jgi:hypothetical protein